MRPARRSPTRLPRRHRRGQRRARRRRRRGRAFVMGFTQLQRLSDDRRCVRHHAERRIRRSVDQAECRRLRPGLLDVPGRAGIEVGRRARDRRGRASLRLGSTGSADFPTTLGGLRPDAGWRRRVRHKLNPAGSALVYSTVLGGTCGDGANGVAVDAAGKAWITGITNSSDFPLTPNAAHASSAASPTPSSPRSAQWRGAPIFDLHRRLELRQRRRHRPRSGQRRLRRRSHLFARLPRDRRRVRYGLQRRPVDLLGRCVRRQDRDRHRYIHTQADAPRAVGAGAGLAVERELPAAADHLRLERAPPGPRPTRFRSTTRAPSPRRWSVISTV